MATTLFCKSLSTTLLLLLLFLIGAMQNSFYSSMFKVHSFLAVALVFSISFASPVTAQTISSAVSSSFTNAQTIDTGVGVINQLAFNPSDEGALYVSTWNNGVIRYDYSEGGVISNPQQVVSPLVALGSSASNSLMFVSNPSFNPTSNGSYGIAFHEDPVLGTVMYLSRALNNVTSEDPRTQGLGSIVRINDADGDGTWGGAGDLNQTIADNIYLAQWVHQITQFAIHEDTLYIGVGSLTNNGGVNFNGDDTNSAIGESAHTASIMFIEDLTLLSNDTTSTNTAWFDIGDDLNDAADVLAFKTDTRAFTSNDPSKLRVYASGLRNPYGVAVDDSGTLWVTNNQGGETASQGDELFRSSFQADHGFNKGSDAVGGDWKDPNNNNPSAQAAQNAGYFQNNVGIFANLGTSTAATGLDFLDAPGNPFDGFIVVARAGNGEGQDAVLVNPNTGGVQELLAGNFGQPTDILIDPYGDILLASGQGQLVFIEVFTDIPSIAAGESIGIDFGTTGTVFGTDAGVAPAVGTNFNEFNTQTADGATASFSGTLINLDGAPTPVGFSVTNNMGKASGLTGIEGSAGPTPFDDATIGVDNYGAANVGNANRADAGSLLPDANMVFTFSGLDDNVTYQVTGGYLHVSPNDNFNSTWDADGKSATTANESGSPDAGYATLSGLSTDGNGNLEITATRSVQLFVAGLTLTVEEPTVLLGDVNLSGEVDFFDISPLISLLSTSGFQEEADINRDGVVNFFDISPFIQILSGQ